MTRAARTFLMVCLAGLTLGVASVADAQVYVATPAPATVFPAQAFYPAAPIYQPVTMYQPAVVYSQPLVYQAAPVQAMYVPTVGYHAAPVVYSRPAIVKGRKIVYPRAVIRGY